MPQRSWPPRSASSRGSGCCGACAPHSGPDRTRESRRGCHPTATVDTRMDRAGAGHSRRGHRGRLRRVRPGHQTGAVPQSRPVAAASAVRVAAGPAPGAGQLQHRDPAGRRGHDRGGSHRHRAVAAAAAGDDRDAARRGLGRGPPRDRVHRPARRRAVAGRHGPRLAPVDGRRRRDPAGAAAPCRAALAAAGNPPRDHPGRLGSGRHRRSGLRGHGRHQRWRRQPAVRAARDRPGGLGDRHRPGTTRASPRPLRDGGGRGGRA